MFNLRGHPCPGSDSDDMLIVASYHKSFAEVCTLYV